MNTDTSYRASGRPTPKRELNFASTKQAENGPSPETHPKNRRKLDSVHAFRYTYICCRGVAQLGSALEWGSRGRAFESPRPDQPGPMGNHRPLFCIPGNAKARTRLAIVLLFHNDCPVLTPISRQRMRRPSIYLLSFFIGVSCFIKLAHRCATRSGSVAPGYDDLCGNPLPGF